MSPGDTSIEQTAKLLADCQTRLRRLERQEQRRLLTDYDWLRGHKSDFLGDQFAPEYSLDFVGGTSSVIIAPSQVGGQAWVQSGNVAGNYARLWLGNVGGGYNTFDADEGWIQIARWQMASSNTVRFWMGANITPALNRFILCGIAQDVNNNWRIRCQDGIGGSDTDSGVAFTFGFHYHALEVYPIPGGRKVDYYLDGTLIAEQTTNVPTDLLTPLIMTYSGANASNRSDWDWWANIPRNP